MVKTAQGRGAFILSLYKPPSSCKFPHVNEANPAHTNLNQAQPHPEIAKALGSQKHSTD